MSRPLADVFPAEVLERVREVEERLARHSRSRDARLDEWTSGARMAGGKRVRPLLLLASFSACGGDTLGPEAVERAIDAAVAIELVHTASLVHDDIMDEADTRRGTPSTYAAYGRDAAILTGDYLFTQAFALAARLPKDAMEMTADACRRLCEGQAREQALHAAGVPDRQAYLDVIRDKTSSLLAAACGIGAHMAAGAVVEGADLDADLPAIMYRYGATVGHAFQILDDVLDVIGDPQWTGKPPGSDFLQGTWGAPYLRYVADGGELPLERRPEAFPAIRERMLRSGAVAGSQLDASGYTQDALLQLQRLPPSPARAALERLAEHLMERTQ